MLCSRTNISLDCTTLQLVRPSSILLRWLNTHVNVTVIRAEQEFVIRPKSDVTVTNTCSTVGCVRASERSETNQFHMVWNGRKRFCQNGMGGVRTRPLIIVVCVSVEATLAWSVTLFQVLFNNLHTVQCMCAIKQGVSWLFNCHVYLFWLFISHVLH